MKSVTANPAGVYLNFPILVILPQMTVWLQSNEFFRIRTQRFSFLLHPLLPERVQQAGLNASLARAPSPAHPS